MEEIDIRNNPVPIEFGFREEWANFTARHPVFVQRMPNIEKALNAAFVRIHLESSLAQRTIYFLGSLIREEFMEILLLSANGYGIGAQKLVRGMYEILPVRALKLGPTQFQTEVERLQAEGRMPSLSELLDVIVDTRKIFVPLILGVRKRRRKS
jgi:hypothetical protein